MKLHYIFLFAFLYTAKLCTAQQSLHNLNNQLIRGQYNGKITDSYFLLNDSIHGLNYIAALRNYYSNLQNGNTFDNSMETISQMFSTTGNYYEAFKLFKFAEENIRLDSSIQDKLKFIYANTTQYIVAKSKETNVTMINEAHDWAQCRAFIIKVLPELRKIGYQYLAMETLNPSATVKSLNALDNMTGDYTAEPVFGELVRYALELGYTLVPYEHYSSSDFDFSDTALFKKFLNERDSMQAVNLSNFISKHSDGKLLVVAGYSHIDEALNPGLPGHSSPFVPMALYFKTITSINPFTINQTQYSESSSFAGEYKWLLKALHPQTPHYSITNISHFTNPGAEKLNDMYIIHPKTEFLNGRPLWLTLNGLRKKYNLKFPKKVMDNLVLIQAYYQNELDDNMDNINFKIPADQFLLAHSNKIDFYLRPNFSYQIVCRDINNNIIYKMKYKAL